MALSSKVGSFNTGVGAAASTVVVTGLGFTPKCILFWWSGRSEAVDTIGRASHYRGFGVAVSATDRRAICSRSADASASSSSQSAHEAAACILSVTSTGPAIDGQIDLQSMDADGFTLVVDDQMPRDLRVHYLALGGDSLTNMESGVFTEPGAIGNQDITALAFQPDCVLLFSAGIAADAPGAAVDSTMMLGAATGPSNRGVWMGGGNNGGGTMQTINYCISSECIALPVANMISTTGRADFVSFLSNGFRVNWTERALSRRVHFLALKGGNYRVDNLLSRTDGADIAETGFGFQPTSALFLSHGQAESTSDTIQNNDRLSIGAFSSLTDRGAQATLDEHNLADSEVTTAIEFDEVYANISASSTIDGLMDVKSIDADGFTMVMDDADPSAAFVWYVAFGLAASGSPPLLSANMKGNFRNPSGRFING